MKTLIWIKSFIVIRSLSEVRVLHIHHSDQLSNTQLVSIISSVTSVGKQLVHLFYIHGAVTCVLVFIVRHHCGLIPNADDDRVLRLRDGASAASCSSQHCYIRLRVVRRHQVLLSAHSATSGTWLARTLTYSERACELVHSNVLHRSVVHLLVVVILVETWPIRGADPAATVNAIDGGMTSNVSHCVFRLSIRPCVLDSPNVRVPAVRHSASLSYNY